MSIHKIIKGRILLFKQIGIHHSIRYIFIRPIILLRSRIMKATKIFENVYIGNYIDGKEFNGSKISVRGEDVDRESYGIKPYSILENLYLGTAEESAVLINKIVNDIEKKNSRGNTLVHCTGGIDRSPFIVMCWLVLKHEYSVEDAYDLIIDKRPIAMRHYEWVDLLRKKNILPEGHKN